jgi:hypothetical protein
MMRNTWLIALLATQLLYCSPQPLVNPAHLAHLYEEIPLGDTTTLGAIWIYCEAPDYRLVDDDDEGFTCVDDVARALVFYCRDYALQPSPEVLKKVQTLSEFLLYMRAESGYFYNFMLPDRQINTTHINSAEGPNWWSWRALWALSELNLLEAPELKALQNRSRTAVEVLIENIKTLCPYPAETATFDGVTVPRCLADQGADQAGVIMIGLANTYRLNPSESVKQQLLFWGNLLLQTQYGNAGSPPYYAFLSWQNYWHAWGNSQAYALLYAGRILEHQPFIEAGLNEVRHFYPYCMAQGFIHEFKVVKTGDSIALTDVKPFSQIAYDIRPMVFASLEAFAVTGDEQYARTAGQLASWFFGNNPAKQHMYDPATGRTFDGIGSPATVNLNSGAESTIEALLTLQAIESVREAEKVLEQFMRKPRGN